LRHFRAGDGAELAFEEHNGGGSTAAVFVHGWQGDHRVWDAVIQSLASDVRAIAVDLRGNGASRAAPGPYSLERFAADLRELIEFLRLPAVVVVGHSIGATVALRFAVDFPEATRALVLIAPVPASGGDFSPKGAAFLRTTPGDPVAVKKWLTRTLADPSNAHALEALCEVASTASRDAALESFESWAYADFAEATRGITVPALVIAPAYDAPEVGQAKVAALLPNAHCIVLPETAHYVVVERPDAIARLIRDFLNQIEKG
jgi:pimeloyl-ACP methyl ester carboxylesterase